ncbi:hypothetical protein Agabi119p4_7836 [Agaricus bisporus var. burnettii]|uniref:Beta-lactamase-related domain-containing protein n=1 Tax=Agaricus bisporus var. burnettii TaxID=192524 RepID=A0A8H7C8I0_AGABI|nr:hypothetical protein Agabi119p4_7836 [Agaricus bisporus var. burnettii]
MVNWVSMLLVLGKHPHQGQQIVLTEVVNNAATGRSIVAGKASFPEMSPILYGASQLIYSYRGHQVVDHGGNILGFSSSVARLPNDNLGIVILNNDWNANSAIAAVKWRLVDEIVIRATSPSSPLVDWVSRYKEIDRRQSKQAKFLLLDHVILLFRACRFLSLCARPIAVHHTDN